MIVNKTVKIKWNARTKKAYIRKGYKFTKYGEQFNACIKDLPINSNIKIIAKCDICGKKKEITYQNYNLVIKNNSKYICNTCKNHCKNQPLKKNTKQFKEEVKKIVGNEYTILGKYKNSYTKLLIRHNKCNGCYYITPNDFLNGHRCPLCRISTQKNIQKAYSTKMTKKLKALYKDKFKLLTPYKNWKTKILIKCLKCKSKYYITPNALKSGKHKCLKCRKINSELKNNRKHKNKPRIKWNDNILKNKIDELTKGEYKYIGSYVNAQTPVLIKHNKCNNIWKIRIHDFIDKGCRCPKCYAAERCKELGISINEWGKSPNRNRQELERWSKKVRKRDSNQCVICGSTENLNAHHLDGYNIYKSERLNVDNGVTLCEKCHQKFHNKYGYGNNTKDQFKQFIEGIYK